MPIFLLLFAVAMVLVSGETGPLSDQTIKCQAKLLAGAPAAELLAPILLAWDKPVGDGFTIAGAHVEAKPGESGKLKVDAVGHGTFRVLSGTTIIPVNVAREVDGKTRTATLAIRFSRGEDGVWRWRDASAVGIDIAGDELLAVDINGDGSFNTPGVDGLLWYGQDYAFPLPGPDERWCSVGLDLTAFNLGPWGEFVEIRGRKLATTVPAALPILQDVNRERSKIGLCPRPEIVANSADLQKHCHYMAVNGKLTHPEDPEKSAYTAEGNAAGKRSILGTGIAFDHFAGWMVSTLYHRIDVVRPQTIAFGVGSDAAYGGIDGRSVLDRSLPVAWPVLCPASNQRSVPVNFNHEMPDPIPAGQRAGFPITAYFPSSDLKLSDGTLTPMGQGKDGRPLKAVDCYRFDPGTPNTAGLCAFESVVALIPKEPLAMATTYHVSMRVAVGGETCDLAWSFETEGAAKGKKKP